MIMTCTLAITAKDGKTIMACDSFSGNANVGGASSTSKVFYVGPPGRKLLIGMAGSWRAANILRHYLILPEIPTAFGELNNYMNTTFVDAVRKTMKEHGFLKNENGVESIDTSMLIAIDDQIYSMSDDFAITQNQYSFDAIGANWPLTMGALLIATVAAARCKLPAKKIAWYALHAASEFTVLVRAPYRVYEAYDQRSNKAPNEDGEYL